MRIVMVGAGAVGGYFGGRMAEAGLDIAFLLRPSSASALRDGGLHVSSPLGDVDIERPAVVDPDARLSSGSATVFFACKAEHLPGAAELARPVVGGEALLVPLQNGVDAPRALSDAFGPERVLGGLSRIFAERVSPGRILHMGFKPSITVGEVGGGLTDRARAIADALEGVPGMALDASPDVWTAMWQKLAMVCSIGAVGAAARAPLGVLLAVDETRELLAGAGAEIAAVARAAGATVDPGFAAAQIARYRALPPETTASMHRDLERRDPSELNDQLGAARRHGRERGVPTPILDALYGALLPGELRARGGIEYRNVAPRRTG